MGARWLREPGDGEMPPLLEDMPAPVLALLLGLVVAWVLLLVAGLS